MMVLALTSPINFNDISSSMVAVFMLTGPVYSVFVD
jgi:hypothetical protein